MCKLPQLQREYFRISCEHPRRIQKLEYPENVSRMSNKDILEIS